MFRTRIFSALCSTPPPPQWNDSLHWWESVVWRYCSWRRERIFLIFILCLHNVRNIAPTSPVRYQCIDRAGMLSRIYVQSGLAHPDSIVYYCSSVCLSVNQPPTSPLQIWRPHFSSLPSFLQWLRRNYQNGVTTQRRNVLDYHSSVLDSWNWDSVLSVV